MGKSLVITLEDREVCSLQRGEFVGRRGGLVPESKVEVYPLSHRDPEAVVTNTFDASTVYLEQRARGEEPHVQVELYGNEDLCLYVPDAALYDRRIGAFSIPRDEIKVPHMESEEAEGRLDIIPRDGVILNFGGSLERLNPRDVRLPDPQGIWSARSSR